MNSNKGRKNQGIHCRKRRSREREGNREETNVNVTEKFEQMLKNTDKICILVVGTSGDGVSTLLNGLFGEEKCQSHEITKKFAVDVKTFEVYTK